MRRESEKLDVALVIETETEKLEGVMDRLYGFLHGVDELSHSRLQCSNLS